MGKRYFKIHQMCRLVGLKIKNPPFIHPYIFVFGIKSIQFCPVNHKLKK